MSNLHKILFGALAVGVLIALVVSFTKGGNTVITEKAKPVGALSSPILPYSFFGFGGIQYWAAGRTTDVGLQQGTSTVCSLQSPVATSTLVAAQLTMHTATATGLALEIGKSSLPSSTTTRLVSDGVIALVAQEHGAYRWSEADYASTTAAEVTSNSIINPSFEFAPNAYLNFKVGSALGADDSPASIAYRNFAPVGSCSAIWLQS